MHVPLVISNLSCQILRGRHPGSSCQILYKEEITLSRLSASLGCILLHFSKQQKSRAYWSSIAREAISLVA